jgi:uncharacterized lipoprotein YbaY
MAFTYKILGQSNPGAAALTAVYTVPAATQTIVSSIIIANRSAVPTAFRISLAFAGAADDPKQYIAFDAPIMGNSVVDFTSGFSLGTGDIIRVYGTLATLAFNISGVEVT